MTNSMAASHARDKRLKDAIFGASAACREAVAKYGAEKVTNATIGTMIDDDGKLAGLPYALHWRRDDTRPLIAALQADVATAVDFAAARY